MDSYLQAQSLRVLEIKWDLDMDGRSIAEAANANKFVRVTVLAALLRASKKFKKTNDADRLVTNYITHCLPSGNLSRVDEDLTIVSILDEALQQSADTIIERVRYMDEMKNQEAKS